MNSLEKKNNFEALEDLINRQKLFSEKNAEEKTRIKEKVDKREDAIVIFYLFTFFPSQVNYPPPPKGPFFGGEVCCSRFKILNF
jgi:hypothetical protein